MRAIGITTFGDERQLRLLDLPIPEPAADEVLIQVRAAGVGPWDVLVRENREGLGEGRAFPIVLGWESAGVIRGVGSSVSEFAVGDAVFAYPFQRGNYVEYVAAPVRQVARKPQMLDFIEAAALPVSGVTALQAITEALDIQAGETLLVTGAAGGTGVLAVQLAAARGAYVIGTARADNHDLLRSLGAAELIDYTRGDFADAVLAAHPGGIDAVLECVPSSTGANFYRSVTTLRPGGRIVSIVTWPNHRPLRPDITASYLIGRPDAQLLARVAELVDAGQLRVVVEQVFALEQAAEAQRALAHHRRGRIVLRIG